MKYIANLIKLTNNIQNIFMQTIESSNGQKTIIHTKKNNKFI